jgi:hypothetical protein
LWKIRWIEFVRSPLQPWKFVEKRLSDLKILFPPLTCMCSMKLSLFSGKWFEGFFVLMRLRNFTIMKRPAQCPQ